jgi:dienelactone hydrolase
MTRRQILSMPAAAAAGRPRSASTSPHAAENARFPGTPYKAYSRCLPDFLRQSNRQALEKRNRDLAGLTTPAAIRSRQRWVRETLWKLIGGMPERTPLNARTMGSFERQGYRVEKVVYESRPNGHVSANLYIPTGVPPPFPGVLFQMGHADPAKAYHPYQRFAQSLARLGFLVLAFDPMGQGERIYYPDPAGVHTRLASSDAEHTLPGKQFILFGDTSTRFQLWDAIRSLDYLAGHPMVDPKRLASTGHSGGATLTMLLAAADDRLAAAAACMGNIENVALPDFLPPGSTDDAEQNFIGAGPLGFDRWDLLYPIAPKPLFVSLSDMDFFSTYSPEYVSNGWEEFQRLRQVYKRLDRPDNLAWGDTPLPHDLAQDSRLPIYNWFARHLKGEQYPITDEPPTEPEPDKTLWVAESGNVVRSFGSTTPFQMLKSREPQRQPVALDQLIAADRPRAGLSGQVLSRVRSYKTTVEALEVRSAPGVFVPAWLMIPDGADPGRPVILVLDAASRQLLWFRQEAGLTVPAGGPVICAADVRGIGNMAPENSPGAPEYSRWHNQEENYAWSSLIFGKPLVGQRVTDILALVSALRNHPELPGRNVLIAANGKLTVPALLTCALEPAVSGLYLSRGLVSFSSVAQTEEHSHSFANFVPGFLNHTDLPEIAASIAPRKIHLAAMVDGGGNALPPAGIRSIYPGSNVTVTATPDWSVESILKLGTA